MPIIMDLASFPNSRIKPRPARTAGDTQIVTIAAGPVVQLLLAANSNRTSVLIRNLDSVNSLYYGYDAAIDGSVGPQGGFLLSPLQSVELEDPGAIYIFNGNVPAVNVAFDEGIG